MKYSEYFLPTLREAPSDAVLISHQLMLRAGMIRQLASGLYSWLPLGLRVLRKVETIVRQELDQSGVQELLMPMVQPAELWQESERWHDYGLELLRFKDRHQRSFVLGPTHEEVITNIIRNEITSYKQLPLNVYQIQTKFRDEVRPRFGIMRGREFLMKDAYSFHINKDCMQKTYQLMFDAYTRIFNRLSLEFCAVEADSGAIGGSASHEFHVIAHSGEDTIVYSDQSSYAANLEKAVAPCVLDERLPAKADCEKFATPNLTTIESLSEAFDIPLSSIVKTVVVEASDEIDADYVALLIRGDHTLNTVKAEHVAEVKFPLVLANNEQIKKLTSSTAVFIGPIKLNIPCIVDLTVANMSDFVAGANETGHCYRGVNWQRDCAYLKSCDLRNAEVGDPTPDGCGEYRIQKGIEVGHIFQLGSKYSNAMNASVLNEQGKTTTLLMGCYGIGVSRIVAAAIEQNHDNKGILWPEVIAPFKVVIVALKIEKSEVVKNIAEQLYTQLQSMSIDVLLDDRKASPGVKFSDAELIGIPHMIVISERELKNNQVEYKARNSEDKKMFNLEQIVPFIISCE